MMVAEISNSPSWRTFLEAMRLERGWSISQFAERCEVSRSTIAVALGNTRAIERPRTEIALKIARGLGIPQLAMAVIAGYMDADTVTDVAMDVIEWPIRKVAPARVEWWNRNGGAYVKLCREQNGLSVEDTIRRWNANWSIPITGITEEDWSKLEHQGIFPTGPDKLPYRKLERLHGVWLWAIVHSCTVGQSGFADLVALAFVMGRITGVGRHRKEWIRGYDDYEKLSVAFDRAMDKTHDRLDVEMYRSMVLDLQLRVPSPPQSANTPTRNTEDATTGTLDWHRIGAEIRKRRKTQQWTIQQAAKLVGVSSQQWSQWESGDAPVTLDVLDRLAKALNTPLALLLRGARSTSESESAHPLELRIRDILPVREVPIYGRIVAGIPLETQVDRRGSAWVADNIPGDFALEVHGDSMIGAGIREGDLVIVQRTDRWEDVPPNSMVVALVDGETTLKYLIREANPMDGDHWWLRAANPRYTDRPIDPARDRVQGVVTSIQTVRPPMAPSSRAATEDRTPDDPLAGLTPDQRQLAQQMIEQMRRANKDEKAP
ncbi:helix-turn-helix domain-containing protein [Sulfobacillus harzensis]|uniref:Helix-turn-helix domain-containing protein n=1 Tax=Sulfobacillus harzensis TaxID=2729629 RepID=A0A7Y0L693_9FIRM|nr:helix-turn-helix domain-containing protein [Sulfobacillus harzensis]NMP24098.1 helix-turn-helix domain-containing protein [Sulfobacillus harzensis]